MPDPFTAVGAEAEQTAWPDFELNLLAWLGAADTGFETDLQWISDHVDTEFDMDVHSDEMATRSKELHSILSACFATVLSKFCVVFQGAMDMRFTDSF